MLLSLAGLFVANHAVANPIELAPGLWQIESEETQAIADEGRLGSRAPVTSSEQRCLDDTTAWLIPADYAEAFNKPGCAQQSFISTPLDFKGVWTCQVDGLALTINMQGEASLMGDVYSTVMTVNGRNETKSVNVRNQVTARRLGACS